MQIVLVPVMQVLASMVAHLEKRSSMLAAGPVAGRAETVVEQKPAAHLVAPLPATAVSVHHLGPPLDHLDQILTA